MATTTASCTGFTQQGYWGGWLPSSGGWDSNQRYAGYIGGYGVTCIRFTTPSFSGTSSSLEFTLGLVTAGWSSVTLRWALCSSNSNRSSYVGTTSSVSDSYQISSGTMSASGLNNQLQKYSFTANAPGLSANTYYYLYLWSYSTSSGGLQVWAPSNHSAVLTYQSTVEISAGIASGSSGYVTSVSGGGTYNYGSSVSLRANLASGAHFVNWVTGGWSQLSTSNPWSFTATSDISAYAVGEGNTYRITYNANGGSGAPPAQSYVWAPSGSTNLSSTIPTRTGYTFLGWSRTSTATSPEYSAGLAWSLSNASNYTLYAVWDINTYTNTVDNWLMGLNSGDGNNSTKTALALPDDTFTADYGSSYRLTANRSSIVANLPNGIKFTGDEDGIGYTHPDGDWYSDPINTTVTQPAHAVTYQYNFRATTYDITYNLNGGTNNRSNPATYNVLYGVTFADPTPPAGSEFSHWEINNRAVTGINVGDTASNFKNMTYAAVKAELAKRTVGNVTVTAIYNSIEATIGTSVTPANSGTVQGAGVYNLGDTCTLTATNNAGYRFSHWNYLGVHLSDTNPYSLVITSDMIGTTRTYTAVFEALVANTITITDPYVLGVPGTIQINESFDDNISHQVTIVLGTQSQTFNMHGSTSIPFVLPVSWSSEFPTSTSATANYSCQTYDGDLLVGTTEGSFIVNLPSTEVPTINSVSYVDTTDVYNHFNVFVAGRSNLTATVSATPARGSTLVEYRIENYEGTDELSNATGIFNLGVIPSSLYGSINRTATVVDSRNVTGTYSSTLNISRYTQPIINNFTITWSNVLDSQGNVTYRQPIIVLNINIGSVSQSQVADSFTYNIKYREEGSSSDTNLYQSATISQNYTGTLTLTGSSYPQFDPNISYEFTLEVTDYFVTISQSLYKIHRFNFTICGDGTLKVGTVYQDASHTNVLAYLDNQNNDGVFDVQCKQLTTTTGSNVIFKGDGSIICDNVVESGH